MKSFFALLIPFAIGLGITAALVAGYFLVVSPAPKVYAKTAPYVPVPLRYEDVFRRSTP